MPTTFYFQVNIKAAQMPFNKWLITGYIVIFCVIALFVFAKFERLNLLHQTTPLAVSVADIQTDKKTGYKLYSDKKFTGQTIEYYRASNNQQGTHLKHKINYVDGIKHGQSLQYFDNGTLAFVAYYDKGKLHGPTISLWENGNIRFIVLYEQGKTQGIARQWYVTGEKYKQLNYVNGLETGLQQAWRKNGKLYANYENINGRIYGLKKANLCFGLEDEILTF